MKNNYSLQLCIKLSSENYNKMLLPRDAATYVLTRPTELKEKRIKQRLNLRSDIGDGWNEIFGR